MLYRWDPPPSIATIDTRVSPFYPAVDNVGRVGVAGAGAVGAGAVGAGAVAGLAGLAGTQ
jgi:hypothetical protein